MIAIAGQRFNTATICLSEANTISSHAPQLDHEAARLEAISQFKILDTYPEKEFDNITQLAALICGTPIAWISFIDADRQWFKSKVGWEASSISCDVGLCAHTLRQQDVLIVLDTLSDERFAANPLVTSPPHIRFYAGVPLIAGNKVLGTLCVLDRVTRELNTQQIEALRTLGQQAVKLLEQRCDVAKVELAGLKHQQPRKKSKKFFSRMAAGLGLASAIMVSVGWVSYQSLNNLVQSADKQVQHYQVLQELIEIRALIQQSLLANYRYNTTGEVRYLQPYYSAAQEMEPAIAQLRQAIADEPKQQRRFATLAPLLTSKIAEIEQRIKIRQTKGYNSALQVQLIREGKYLTDKIEALLLEMETAENQFLTQQSQVRKVNSRNIIWAFSGGIMLGFWILAWVYHLIHREIAQRQQIAVALEKERDFTFAVLDQVASLVVIVDSQGRIVRLNSSCEQTSGYYSDEVKGNYFWDLCLLPEQIGTVKAVLKKLLIGQLSNQQYQAHWKTRDGSLRLIAWSYGRICDSSGAVEYAIASGIDITEQSSTQEVLRSSEQHLRNIINSLFTFVAVLTPEGILVQANQALLEAAALQPQDVLGIPLIETYWWSYSPDVQSQLQKAIQHVSQGEKVRYEVEKRISNNQFITIDFALTPMFDPTGKVSYLIASGIDVTERKQAEAERQQANEQLSGWVNELKQRNREITLLSEMNDFLQACLTLEEACTTLAQLVQPLFAQTSGGIFLIRAAQNLVEPIASWGVPILVDLQSFTTTDCWALRRGKPHWVNDTDNGLLCKHLHHSLPAESLCVPMMAQGEALGVLYLSSLEKGSLTTAKQQLAATVAEHIALALANLKLRETLQNQSVRDSLTGLFNRRYMEESLDREMRRCDRKQQPLSIIMLDVDHFKHFNDSFGHNAGDAVLRALGQFLQKYVRGSDIACRYGGEEFTLILPEACLSVTQQRAEQIREAARHLNIEFSGQQIGSLTLSLGVACYPNHGLEGEAILKAADAALYRAKQEGRDRVIIAA